ncbi:hypothetical protein BST95_16160 [Halioglobus japonicus]|uniref:Glycosyltransferase family 2 protein n=1 Tax=Halioglobus japonicus TaxID=930805 RepID=A0AAP8MHA9_9GAMM|nr:glycosyltransferase family A protein [Halioglobus japonicus]AQA19539.1 hypothetical protein BST95_16160 [Halioglobus japonicus]PLW87394.1 glycosyltransferase family 2 protein [Halioglobus japonicus]
MSCSTKPLASLITPTLNLEKFLALQTQTLKDQTYSNIEWLVHDSSDAASETLSTSDDTRIRYYHQPGEMSIGSKRNFLIGEAQGDVIIHLDDDDFYAPTYVETMVEALEQGHDLVKLSGFFLYSSVYRKLGYWDLSSEDDYCQIWSAGPLGLARKDLSNTHVHKEAYWGYGFSYAYRRHVAEQIPFPDKNWSEDTTFILEAIEQFNCHAMKDQEGLVLQILHESNTSKSYPQHSMPGFAVAQFFPGVHPGFL